MEQNLDIFDFTLTADEMHQIEALNQHDQGTINFADMQFVKHLIETYLESTYQHSLPRDKAQWRQVSLSPQAGPGQMR